MNRSNPRRSPDHESPPQSVEDPDSARPKLAQVVHRNIQALLEMRQRHEAQKNREDRVADHITAFAGSMRFVYFHATLLAVWMVVNLGILPWVRPFDPYPFVLLATMASIEAIFLSTFVLISQTRMSESADRRADLDLQISLLAEHEITRLIQMVDALSRRLNIDPEVAEDLEELKQEVPPEALLEEIEVRDLTAGAPGAE
jgi:uncharacterized membrane protein